MLTVLNFTSSVKSAGDQLLVVLLPVMASVRLDTPLPRDDLVRRRVRRSIPRRTGSPVASRCRVPESAGKSPIRPGSAPTGANQPRPSRPALVRLSRKRGKSPRPPRPKHRRERCFAPRRCGTDLKVASHSVGAGLPPNRAASRAQPFRAPVCQASGRSVESAPNLKTVPLRGMSDAGICDPDMVSSTRQNNGETVPHGTIGSSMPRVIQRPATNSPATPADRNGRRPQKGRRSRRNAGKPAVSLRSTAAPADQNREAPTRRCRRSTDQTEPPPATRASA